MKVVLITKTFDKGGAASGARNLHHALHVSGAEVVLYDSGMGSRKLLFKIKRVLERIFERLLFDPEVHCVRFFEESLSLLDVYRKEKPDIIQLCDVSGNLVDLSRAKNLPCPVVHRMSDFWPYHGARHYGLSESDSSFLARTFFSMFIRTPDRSSIFNVAPSEWLRDSLSSQASKGVEFIPNAVEMSKERSRLRLVDPGFISIGFISNSVLDPRKGFIKLYNALEQCYERVVPIKLIVYGRLRERDKVFSNNFEVVYNESFNRDDIVRVYGSFDLLACPSRVDNSPNVVTEALAHGCPVIGQIGTGMASYINPSYGSLVDFWAGDKISDDLSLFLNRFSGMFSEMSKNSLKYVEDNLAPDKVGRRYLDLYSRLIDGKKQENLDA